MTLRRFATCNSVAARRKCGKDHSYESIGAGRTLILAHKDVLKPEITDKLLGDDYILEVTWDGDILWDWLASDHVDELGFSEEARNTIYRFPGQNEERGTSDWLHINAMAYVGPNRWYDDGD